MTTATQRIHWESDCGHKGIIRVMARQMSLASLVQRSVAQHDTRYPGCLADIEKVDTDCDYYQRIRCKRHTHCDCVPEVNKLAAQMAV